VKARFDTEEKRIQAVITVANDARRDEPMQERVCGPNDNADDIIGQYDMGFVFLAEDLAPDEEDWGTEQAERNDANDAIAAFDDEMNSMDDSRTNWQVKVACIQKIMRVTSRKLKKVIKDSDLLGGEGGAKPVQGFEFSKAGLVASILFKEWYGYDTKSSKRGTLLDESNSNDENKETFYCGVLPTLFFVIRYLQVEKEDHLSFKKLCLINVKQFETSLKRKLKNYGWWSQEEVVRRLKVKDEKSDLYIKEPMSKQICKGVEYRFLRVACLTIKNFLAFDPDTRKKLAAKVWASDQEKKLVRTQFLSSFPAHYTYGPKSMKWD